MRHAPRPTAAAPVAAEAPTLRALPVEPAPAREARERLLRQLAADRLRDLRDDGVTLAYVARMYGVEPAFLEEATADLGRRA